MEKSGDWNMRCLAFNLAVLASMILCVAATAQEVERKLPALPRRQMLYDLPHQLTKEGRLWDKRQALEAAEKKRGKNHLDVALALLGLANEYRRLGRYSEAEPLYLRSLKITELKLGKNHIEVASSLGFLARTYQAQGRYSEAEPLFKRSLKIKEQKLGKDHPDVALCLDELGELYQAQGRYSEAEALFRQSLAMMERSGFYFTQYLDRLAKLYQTQGRYSEAEPLYERSLNIRKQNWGKDHPSLRPYLIQLALLYQAQERYSEAESILKRCSSEEDIVMLYIESGNLPDAEPLIKRLKSNSVLGMWSLRHSDYAKAKDSYTELLNNAKKSGNAEVLFVASTGLGAAQEGLENYPEAIENYTRAKSLVDNLASGLDPSQKKIFLEVKIGGFKRSEPAAGLKRIEMKLNKSAASPAE
jgi:tetratricopeptide (TPR) repeat protein